MTIQLRQICLVAELLAPVIDDLTAILGIHSCYVDPGVGKLTITAAVWAGADLSFTGTGVIAEIDVVLSQNGNTTIEFDGNEIFRNPDNETITISEAVGGFMTNP